MYYLPFGISIFILEANQLQITQKQILSDETNVAKKTSHIVVKACSIHGIDGVLVHGYDEARLR